MKEPRPFRPKLFLYRTLLLIFVTEFLFLAFAFVKCSQPIPGKPVPLLQNAAQNWGALRDFIHRRNNHDT